MTPPATQHTRTFAEIDIEALRHNLGLLKNAIGTQRRLILVVKSDAYGHGAVCSAQVAGELGIGHFAVATVEEGVQLREQDIVGEVLLLHAASFQDVNAIIDHDLTPAISTESAAHDLSHAALGRNLGVQIEVNTGLTRLGFDWNSAAESIATIARLPNLRITGIFTHYRAHLTPAGDSIEEQSARLNHVLEQLTALGLARPLVHAASSYPAAFHPHTYFDGIRVGVIAYGALEKCPPPLDQLRPVMSVRSEVMHVRRIHAGDWVHYGAEFRADRDMTIAVIPIGYGMGYPRHLSNIGEMLVRGQRCRITGVIGMDMTMIDVTQVSDEKLGEPITVMGRDGESEITAVELAEKTGTISYEITCRLGNGLNRVVMNERQT